MTDTPQPSETPPDGPTIREPRRDAQEPPETANRHTEPQTEAEAPTDWDRWIATQDPRHWARR